MSTEIATIEQSQSLDLRGATLEQIVGMWLTGYESERTRQAYRRDLEAFVAWATAEPRPVHRERGYEEELPAFDPLQASRPLLDLYARWLQAEGLAASTRARRLASLSSFYAYCAANDPDRFPVNPAASVRRPTVSDESPRLGLDRGELAALLQAAADSSHAERDLALVSLLGLLGLRVSEACAAEAHDLSEERGHRLITVTRKGGKAQRLPLDPFVADALDAALQGRSSGPILLANDGGPLDRFDAARAIRRLARAAGIEHRVSPHDLRHSFVTLALEAGKPLHLVADAAGHSDPRTTRRYDRQRHALEGHASYAVAGFVLAPGSSSPAA